MCEIKDDEFECEICGETVKKENNYFEEKICDNCTKKVCEEEDNIDLVMEYVEDRADEKNFFEYIFYDIGNESIFDLIKVMLNKKKIEECSIWQGDIWRVIKDYLVEDNIDYCKWLIEKGKI